MMAEDKFPRFSNMDFIPDDAYPIEDSGAYINIKAMGIRSVEFVRIINDRLLFIEARSSVAHPDNSPEPYRVQINEIYEKFVHSLNLMASIKIGIIKESLPASFNSERKLSLEFVLVVRDHKPEWCRRVRLALYQLLPEYLVKIWRPEVMVVNYEKAKEYDLVS